MQYHMSLKLIIYVPLLQRALGGTFNGAKQEIHPYRRCGVSVVLFCNTYVAAFPGNKADHKLYINGGTYLPKYLNVVLVSSVRDV